MKIKAHDHSQALQAQVIEAHAASQHLHVCGGHSKRFYGHYEACEQMADARLDVTPHTGVISYQPEELVITVRAGTRLSEVNALLAENQQYFPFEPPLLSDSSTIGGVIASGFSGLSRPYKGAVRDAILGVTVLNAAGEIMRFGGEVMKNVAGYDMSRLMVGSMGTLGVLLDVSIRVAPLPEKRLSFSWRCDLNTAHQWHKALCRKQHLLDASAYYDGRIYLRIAGYEEAVKAVQKSWLDEWKHTSQSARTLPEDEAEQLWLSLNQQQHEFYTADHADPHAQHLWSIQLPQTENSVAAEMMALTEGRASSLLTWGNRQLWVWLAHEHSEALVQQAQSVNASVSLQRAAAGHALGDAAMHLQHLTAMPEPIFKMHRAIKEQLDPTGMFNRQRMYLGL